MTLNFDWKSKVYNDDEGVHRVANCLYEGKYLTIDCIFNSKAQAILECGIRNDEELIYFYKRKFISLDLFNLMVNSLKYKQCELELIAKEKDLG